MNLAVLRRRYYQLTFLFPVALRMRTKARYVLEVAAEVDVEVDVEMDAEVVAKQLPK
jgi:hypothetical protein